MAPSLSFADSRRRVFILRGIVVFCLCEFKLVSNLFLKFNGECRFYIPGNHVINAFLIALLLLLASVLLWLKPVTSVLETSRFCC